MEISEPFDQKPNPPALSTAPHCFFLNRQTFPSQLLKKCQQRALWLTSNLNFKTFPQGNRKQKKTFLRDKKKVNFSGHPVGAVGFFVSNARKLLRSKKIKTDSVCNWSTQDLVASFF